MPFGLTNAPTTFQAYISRVLRGLINVFYIVYLNNILIFFRNLKEYQKHLELVIKRLRYVDLYVNP